LLLRVPGLGVRNVDRILRIRRWHSITVADLTRLRVPLKKTLPFIIAADHRPHLLTLESACSQRNSAQLELFTAT
jgi:predicted DNA-binding helix-hairpin-helix protein